MPHIAVILPIEKPDYLANTILDGLIGRGIEFKVTPKYPAPFSLESFTQNEADFIEYALNADLIILCWGKGATNIALAEKIGKWEKTIFVDGSELGKDRRFDPKIAAEVEAFTYEGSGAINKEMLSKCKRYFRREKPYVEGILPLPFGIERRYRSFYGPHTKKDIDFVCIFGQEDFPKLRKEARLRVETFSKKNGFVSKTEKTRDFTFDDNSKQAGRDEFYELLARAKVGVSIGGGGYDTARFWEIYGNGCILLTEKIDIKIPEGAPLAMDRIHEFKDIGEFQKKLEEIGNVLKHSYVQPSFEKLVDNIEAHSTGARVDYVLQKSL
jgi:hypothetical protein